MKRFTQLFHALDATPATKAKVAALEDYFATESPANAVWALYLLLGKTRRRLVTSRVLRQVFLTAIPMPDWLFEDCYAQVGDSAEVIALLWPEAVAAAASSSGDEPLPQDQLAPPLPLHDWMEQVLPQVKAATTEEERQHRILSWWRGLEQGEIFVLNKILTGAFRVGVSEKLVIRGLAAATGVPEAVLAHRLMGEFDPTIAFYHTLLAPETEAVSPSQPYPFYLASALEPEKFAQEDPRQWRAEWKWDGIRAQGIKRADEVFIWSRGEELITLQFPEIAAALAALPNGVVVDGEILGWQGERPLPFHALQKRLGRKRVTQRLQVEHPVRYVVYDLLEVQGQDIRQQPWGDRRQQLHTLLAQYPQPQWQGSVDFGFQDMAQLTTLRDQARHQGAEGLMVKAIASPYLVGRQRGHWWKYKLDPMTLDAVLIYAQAGSGKRANLFTDYTFALWQGEELVPFAKAYSGLDNREIDQLDQWIRRHTVERFGPVRSVEPVQVFEIGFEGIAPSSRHKSGISVRFPRILRWRTDKAAPDADTLQAAQALLAAYAPSPQSSLTEH